MLHQLLLPSLVVLVNDAYSWGTYILPPRRPSSSICSSSLTTTKSRASSHSRASRRCCWRRHHRHFSCDAAFFLFGTITSATPMTATTFRRKKVSLMTHEETKWQTIKITKTLTTFSFPTPAIEPRNDRRFWEDDGFHFGVFFSGKNYTIVSKTK